MQSGMNKKTLATYKIGILGGGQLARMLALAGHDAGFEMHVLSEKENDPAAQVTQHWHKGNLSSVDDVKKFVSGCDVVTIESEFLDKAILKACALAPATQSSTTPFHP